MVTLLYYWMVQNGDATTSLSPATYSQPDAQLVTEQLSKQGINVTIYTGETYRTYTDAYSLFVKGAVYNGDVECFVEGLQGWWQRQESYDGAMVEVISRDLYFHSR